MRDFTGLLKLAQDSGKSSGMSRGDKWRLAGTGSVAAGAAIPLAFLLRGKVRSAKALKLIAADAAKYGGDVRKVSDAIYRHMRSTGAELPRHEFVKAVRDIEGRGYRTSMNGAVRILEDGTVIQDAIRKETASQGLLGKLMGKLMLLKVKGPAYSPKGDFITPGAGNMRHLSPTALLHELGHAADYDQLGRTAREIEAQGNPFASPYALKPKDWLKAIFKPSGTDAFKLEQRAWDNARVAADNEIRRAALGTYENAMQAQGVNNTITPALLWGGVGMRRHGRKLNEADK